MRERRRLAEFEVMRGVAILFVVYLHAVFTPWEDAPQRQILLYRITDLFAHSAVPAFFFLSAFLLAKDSSETFRDFALKKAHRILVPLAFWVLAVVAFRIWQADGATDGLARSAVLLDVSGHFFFLGVLALFTIAAWPFRQWTDRSLAIVTAVAFLLNLATIRFYEGSVVSGDFAIFAYRNPFTWVFFFAFGYWAGRKYQDLEWSKPLALPALGVMTMVGAVYLVAGERNGEYPTSYFGVTVFLFSTAAIVAYSGILTTLYRWRNAASALAPFEFLGRYSFAIYLVHMPFFVGFVTQRYVSGSRLQDDWLDLVAGLYTVGLLTSLAFVVVVAKLAPRFATEFLGVSSSAGTRRGAVRARAHRTPPLRIVTARPITRR